MKLTYFIDTNEVVGLVAAQVSKGIMLRCIFSNY